MLFFYFFCLPFFARSCLSYSLSFKRFCYKTIKRRTGRWEAHVWDDKRVKKSPFSFYFSVSLFSFFVPFVPFTPSSFLQLL